MRRRDRAAWPSGRPGRGPAVLACCVSLGLHGAAIAGLLTLLEWTPSEPYAPEPYAAFPVELVQDPGPAAKAGRDDSGSSPSPPAMDRPLVGEARDAESAMHVAASERDHAPLGPELQKTIPQGPAAVEAAVVESPVASEVADEAAAWVAPAPRRKPLPPRDTADRDSRAAEPADESDRTHRRAERQAASGALEGATSGVEKSLALAALPGSPNGDGDVGGPGGPSETLPRYAGGGLSNAPPRYPHLARRRGQEGRVVLRVQVSAAGAAAMVTVRRSSGHRLLDEAAVDAVKAWRFAPASLGGVPVTAALDVPVSFELTNR